MPTVSTLHFLRQKTFSFSNSTEVNRACQIRDRRHTAYSLRQKIRRKPCANCTHDLNINLNLNLPSRKLTVVTVNMLMGYCRNYRYSQVLYHLLSVKMVSMLITEATNVFSPPIADLCPKERHNNSEKVTKQSIISTFLSDMMVNL